MQPLLKVLLVEDAPADAELAIRTLQRAGIACESRIVASERELASMRQVDYVDLPTGHWPQFSRPAELGRILVDVIGR